ncbi:vacuolar ATP synthase subunit h, putative [Plasmodium knowlesi strain H]|uniref:V-type proton ATPase subunit H n=3 Tax=Plasmodium knowlesi TaxID=5850 RepID=A0A1A7VVW3_PLAKH|nr:V-type proton ATPase subunit H, putative [Plasmodium knowlesi strain H]OTN63826.1 putative Vacuolar ATP synthase subunit h [Plasmodium knowlesi]CAA9990667.1 V-type proton ATPase subunit H, putative [Plasmodium knowlesi strain H]SBO25957.1 vacuolar ATP synthase subunit h, putative [Plasmodium knowlesi strain H]SBO28691.1 vacuolar ATP synthase subunit h, putative [Plasmodium knowlesi strain H]VVS80141.1 V-type proton ATPase subunit H, putative [Plasmodium knowlesi strain H]
MATDSGISVISKIVESEQKSQILHDSILNKMPCYDKYEEINILSSEDVELLKKFHAFNKKEKFDYFKENNTVVTVLFNCLQTDFNVHLIQYVLTIFYEIIRNDGSSYSYILSILNDKGVYSYLMKLCTHNDTYIADKSSFLLSGSFCYNSNNNYFTETEIKDFILKIDFFNVSEEGKMDIYINILKIDNYRKDIYELEQFLTIINKNLDLSNNNANKQYKSVFCVWLLTFKDNFIKKLYKNNIISVVINLFKKCRVEKILRVSLNIIKNIMHMDDCFEIIVDNNIIQTLTVLQYDKWRDNDIYDTIVQLLHKLDQRVKNYSNFERYCHELSKGKLKWSVLHTEKFWLENVMQFERDEFKAIQQLADIIKSYAHNIAQKSDSMELKEEVDGVTVAVACFDIGEFARLYPNGKKICQKFRIKENVMILIATKDRDIVREALLCAQKIMLNNWQSISNAK